MNNGWVDATQRLPDTGVRVLIFIGNTIIIGVCASHHPLWYNDGGYEINDVKAWKLLPDPPVNVFEDVKSALNDFISYVDDCYEREAGDED